MGFSIHIQPSDDPVEPDAKPSDVFHTPWIWAKDRSGKPMNRSPAKTGKWMLFNVGEKHDLAWEKVRVSTELGELGPSAKAATAFRNLISNDSSRALVICVYTYDYCDEGDVRRVLVRLREIGVTEDLSYKTNADTRTRNYGEGVALYVSRLNSNELEVRRNLNEIPKL